MSSAGGFDGTRTLEERPPRLLSPATASLFAVLWAAAHLLHSWHQGGSGMEEVLTDPGLILVIVAALWLLGRPASSHRLVLLAAAQLVAFSLQLPLVANHWTIAAFVNAGLVLAYVGSRAGRRTVVPLVVAIGTYARVVFIVAYSAAAIAKLNSTFFDAAKSCALFTLDHAVGSFGLRGPGPGDALAEPTIWLVAGIELAVPVLLVLRPTRLYGVALAIAFHVVLALTPVVLVMDFTAFLVALLVMFTPGDSGDRVFAHGRFFAKKRPAMVEALREVRTPVAWIAAAAVFALAVFRGPLVGPSAWAAITWVVVALYGLGLLLFGLAVVWSYRGDTNRAPMPGAGRGPSAPQWLLIGLLMLNAASPYLGGKTTSSFTMFSNLRTEAGSSNHFFVPRLPVDSPQDDLVEIRRSSNSGLQELADDDELLTSHELQRALAGDREASIEYVRDGQVHDLERAADDRDLVEPAWLGQKFWHFRSVAADGMPSCQA